MAKGRAFSRRTALGSIAVAVVGLLLLTAWRALPRIGREAHPTVSTPVPTGMRAPAPIQLRAGARVCVGNVAFDPDGELLRLWLEPGQRFPSPPLQVELDAPGYAADVIARQARRWDPLLQVPVRPPAESTVGTVCVRNAGRTATALDGTADPRVLQNRRATLDGVEQPAAFLLTFVEDRPSDAVAGLGEALDHAAAFNALGPWAYWLLLALVAGGVPLLVLGALYRALRTPDAFPEADGNDASEQ